MSGRSGDFEPVTAPRCAEAAAAAAPNTRPGLQCLRGRRPASERWGLPPNPPAPRPGPLPSHPSSDLRSFDKYTSSPYYVPGAGTQLGKALRAQGSLSRRQTVKKQQNKNELEQGLPFVSEVDGRRDGWPASGGGVG